MASTRTGRAFLSAALTALTVLLAACATGGEPGGTTTPPPDRSIVVLGHSGATGYNSAPANPGSDARGNSWATGTNLAVNSVYQRLAAHSPEYTGHNVNLAVDGATVDDLLAQANRIPAGQPSPGVVLIQIVDNDIRCDGTEQGNYQPFGDTLRVALTAITQATPDARIYLLSQWATVDNNTAVVATLPGGPEADTGDGPCDTFDQTGRTWADAATYLQDVVDNYHRQLDTVCAAYPTCRYDDGAMQHLTFVGDDLSPDLNHLSIAGHAKYAHHAWNALFKG